MNENVENYIRNWNNSSNTEDDKFIISMYGTYTEEERRIIFSRIWGYMEFDRWDQYIINKYCSG